MNQKMLDLINGVEPDTSDKIMQCEVCQGFYPVPHHWATLIRCHECGWLDYALYNRTPVVIEGAPVPITERSRWYMPRLGY